MICLGSRWAGPLIGRQNHVFSYFPFDVRIVAISGTIVGGGYGTAQLVQGASLAPVGPLVEWFQAGAWQRIECDILVPGVTEANVDGDAKIGYVSTTGGGNVVVSPVFEVIPVNTADRLATVHLKADAVQLFNADWGTRYGWDRYTPIAPWYSGFRYINECAPPGASTQHVHPQYPDWNRAYPEVANTPLALSGTFYGLTGVADPGGWPVQMGFALRVDAQTSALGITCATGGQRVFTSEETEVHVAQGQMVNFLATAGAGGGDFGGHVLIAFRPDSPDILPVGWDEAPWDTTPWGP